MASLTLTAADEVLKIVYGPEIVEQFNYSHVLVDNLSKTDENFPVPGKVAYIPIHTARNPGSGARKEQADLPTAGTQGWEHYEYVPKYLYMVIGLTAQTMKATEKDKQAFIRALENEKNMAMKDAMQDLSRQCWHDGSAILTGCGVTTASTTVVVNSTKHIIKGMIVDILLIADGTVGTGGVDREVLTVPSSTTFTISGAAITTAATYCVIKSGNRNSAETTATGTWGLTSEIWGLQALISNANPGNGLTELVGNKTRTSNPIIQANVVANGGTLRDLDEDLMQQAIDLAEIASGKDQSLMITSHAIRRRYAALLVPDRRFVGEERNFKGGFKTSISYNDFPLLVDRHAGKALDPSALNGIYFLNLSSMQWQEQQPWEWMDETGSILRQVGRKDEFEASMRCFTQLAIIQPNANSLLTDIKEAA